MIFAAGFGTRLGDLVTEKPKPLINIGDTTLLDHSLVIAKQAGVKNVVVNAHYLSHKIVEHLTCYANTQVIVEEPDILDTGGGLLNALPLLGGKPLFTMNADNYWFGRNPLQVLAKCWGRKNMDALLMLGTLKNTHGFQGKGDFVIDSNGNITRRKNQDTGLVYLGAQIINPSVIGTQFGRAFSLNLIWDNLIHNKRIKGLIYDGQWAVIDTPYGLETIRKIL